MSALHAIYHALGDPTRLEIVERLGERGPQTTLTLVEGLGMSRQAATKHLLVLEQAGLVESEVQGRRVVRRLRMEPLTEAHEWLDRRASAWEAKLDALKRFVESD